jgi:geranylgeranyl diphosphate synthase, type I
MAPLRTEPPGSTGRDSEATARWKSLLGRVRPEIDRRLAALWEGKLAELRRYGPEVVAMASAAADLTLRGGKRFRPALLLAAHEGVAQGAPPGPAFTAGVALELLQSYLLIQDDWMDGDATRRGAPSVHVSLAATLGAAHLGAASAMLSSDLTWGLALRELATLDAPPARVLEALRLFWRVHEDVVIGQQIDMLGKAGDVEAMHALKTGSYTVRGPLLLGATLAGGAPSTLEALERFAAPLGVAFQLRDDLLGTFGAAEETGKPVGNDLRAGKRTAVLAEAEGRLDEAGRAALARVLGHADAGDEAVAEATVALQAGGVREAVEARLRGLCEQAALLAGELPVSPEARLALAGAAEALLPGGAG